MEITVVHNMPQEEALAKVKTALYEAGAAHSDKITDVQEEWDGYVGKCSFKTMGFKVNAMVKVEPTYVRMEGSVPFLVRPFESKIKALLRENMLRVLS